MNSKRPVMEVDELAQLLGVSSKRIYTLIAQSRIPGVIRLGRRILLSRHAVERWLDGAQDGQVEVEETRPESGVPV